MTTMQIAVPHSIWHVECRRADGSLRWEENFKNLVFTAAINDVLGVYFKALPAKTSWHIGLLNSNAVLAATDTAALHPGWTENVNYNSATRPQLVLGGVTDKQVNNNLSKAVFTMIGAAGAIVGVFLISDSAKGGSQGLLYAAAPFPSGVKNMAATDTLTVAVALSGV